MGVWTNGKNFVRTMLKLAKSRNEINVMSDQIGAPIYTKDFVALIVDLVQSNKYGTYHGVNKVFCSYEFVESIFEKSGIDMKVNPISTED